MPETFTIELTAEEALVLFEMLARTEPEDEIVIEHEAERKVLWTVEAILERTLLAPLDPEYAALLATARSTVCGTHRDRK